MGANSVSFYCYVNAAMSTLLGLDCFGATDVSFYCHKDVDVAELLGLDCLGD